jgi:cysteine desulfurase
MLPYFTDRFGNPSSLHRHGQDAIASLDRSRAIFARALSAQFHEILFTGSATEANNLAIRGAAIQTLSQKNGPGARPRVIVSAIEHESVLETAKSLATQNIDVVEAPVTRSGVVDIASLDRLLTPTTILLSVMYVNNETGSLQPIRKISAILERMRASNFFAARILFHTDASQAFSYYDCRADFLGADLITLSSHKIHGPKGVGCLYVRMPNDSRLRYPLSPLITGGGQEFGMRSGTEAVPLVAGFAAAAQEADELRTRAVAHVSGLRDDMLKELKRLAPRIRVNGEGGAHIANVVFPYVAAQEMLVRLDRAGICASAGSACSTRSSSASHVLLAMGRSPSDARHSLRFSFSRSTKRSDISAALRVIASAVPRKRGSP